MWLTQIVASARQLKSHFTKKREKADVEVWTRKPWREEARPNQLPPEGWDTGAYQVWLVCAGRGFGKTRLGAETVIEEARKDPNARIALVGRTAADVRDVMIRGQSGIIACSPPDFRPIYKPSARSLTWPNGAIATAYSAEKPSQLRGPQFTFAWADELAAWFAGARKKRRSRNDNSTHGVPEAWDQLMMTLRLGDNPRAIATTTPTPTKVIRELIASATTFVTRGSTYDNAKNLAQSFIAKIVSKYEGTRLGRQELEGEVLDDNPGALWNRDKIDELRVKTAPDLWRIVIAIDPAATSGDDSDETGITVGGIGHNGHGYLLEDLSGRFKPDEWATRAINALDRYNADRIVAEVNHGGEMVESVLRATARGMFDRGERKTASVPFRAVRASKGKDTRAEPIAALCEQKLIHHVERHPNRLKDDPRSRFTALEDQLVTWDPALDSDSPDRLDAYVWLFTDLPIGTKRRSTEESAPKTKSAEQEFAEARGW